MGKIYRNCHLADVFWCNVFTLDRLPVRTLQQIDVMYTVLLSPRANSWNVKGLSNERMPVNGQRL
jgi:hypothetical protein